MKPMMALKDRRVLLVEDNDDLRDVLGSLLRGVGCDTVVASTAQDAVAAVRRGRFDVVVSDVSFPGGGARFLGEELNRLQQSPAVILMTGDVSSIECAGIACLESAIYLEKPFNISRLLTSVAAATQTPASSAA